MVILMSQNKITDFLMILAWANPFNMIKFTLNSFAGEYASHFEWYSFSHLISPWPSAPFEIKRNESGFRPPFCTYRLNWARITSRGWWDKWNDTALQTQDSKYKTWMSESEHATSWSRSFTEFYGWMGKKHFCFFQTAEIWKRTPNSSVKGPLTLHLKPVIMVI